MHYYWDSSRFRCGQIQRFEACSCSDYASRTSFLTWMCTCLEKKSPKPFLFDPNGICSSLNNNAFVTHNRVHTQTHKHKHTRMQSGLVESGDTIVNVAGQECGRLSLSEITDLLQVYCQIIRFLRCNLWGRWWQCMLIGPNVPYANRHSEKSKPLRLSKKANMCSFELGFCEH